MSEAEKYSEGFGDFVKQRLKRYIAQQLQTLPISQNPMIPVEETEEIPIDHPSVSTVLFYTFAFTHGRDEWDTTIGMILHHHRRNVGTDEEQVITTDLNFRTFTTELPRNFLELPLSLEDYDGAHTRFETSDENLIKEVDDDGGAYELILSVLESLHTQRVDQFPGISSILTE